MAFVRTFSVSHIGCLEKPVVFNCNQVIALYIYSYSEVDHKSFKTRRSPENLTFKERQQLFSLAMVTSSKVKVSWWKGKPQTVNHSDNSVLKHKQGGIFHDLFLSCMQAVKLNTHKVNSYKLSHFFISVTKDDPLYLNSPVWFTCHKK